MRRYSYLMRIAAVCLAVWIGIALLLSWFVEKRSAEEVDFRKDDFLEQSAYTLSLEFDRQVKTFKEHAAMLSVRNQEADDRIELSKLKAHSYYAYEAASNLSKHGDILHNADIYLAFYGDDIILSTTKKYSVDEFAVVNNIDPEINASAVRVFLSTYSSGVRFLSSFSAFGTDTAKLYCGMPITLNADKCIAFYAIDHTVFNDSIFSELYGTDTHYYIVRADGTLLLSNNSSFDEVPKSDLLTFLDAEETEVSVGDHTYFKHYDATYDMYFLVKHATVSLYGDLAPLHQAIRSDFERVLAAAILLLVPMICFLYRPIRKLVKERGASVSGSELARLRKGFVQLEATVETQREMLLAHLLADLLNAMPITEASAARFPEVFTAERYVVCTAAGLRLTSAQRHALCEDFRSRSDAALYPVDILQKNQTAFILLPKENDDHTSILTELLRTAFGETVSIGISSEVPHYTALFDAYMESLSAFEYAGAVSDGCERELSEIDTYVSEHTALFLGFVRSGDADSSQRILTVLRDYIEREVSTSIYRRYLVYNLLIAYLKLLRQLDLPQEPLDPAAILSHTDLNAMFDTLSRDVRRVCIQAASKNLTADDSLHAKVMAYINETYTDVNFCRDSIADHFGISLYTLSSILKDSIDVSFKEYVNAKRLALSKTLLVTTDASIVEIATKAGFANADYFSKVFRAAFDMPPSRFRELNRD